ncbi:EF-hand domain-containing protein [Novosphingobium sp. PS1R-30]|uniref:EF-hand domain-containing protein n=1 Tax=Novosphingobium anseongense TaxID=3133436 RepID=A0ABU8RWV6_9SPHN
MTLTRKIALGISLTATALAGAAYAEQSARQDRRDAPVTRAEAQAKAQEHFARMDVNKDGKVDQADRAARRAAMFDRIDTDKNGQISRAEFDGAHQRGPQAAGAPGERGPGMRGHGGPGRGHWGHRGSGRAGGFGPGADADKNGAVTQAEFTQAALTRFDRTDANKDGTVTKEERQAARQALRDQAREQWQNRAGAPATPKAN